MGKTLLVCLTVEDTIRPLFFQKWTEFHKGLLLNKFTVDLQLGIESLVSVSDDYDYVLLLSSSVLMETDHFMTLFYKMTDKDVFGAILRDNVNTVHCIENIDNGIFMSSDELKGRETPFMVDCASTNFLLLKKNVFEHLREKEMYAPFEVTLVNGETETKGSLPLSMSIFFRLKDKGVRTWVDPAVQIKQIFHAII